MSEKLNQQLNIIIKAWQIFAMIIGFILAVGGAYYQVFANKDEIEKLKDWKEKRIQIDLDLRDIKTKLDFLYVQKLKDLDKQENNHYLKKD